ncbi:corepressor complex CRC230 [Toxoplasma gondii p89]|uniref:Corepressor complex CRC230 n=1 Tax=Toxoplasma gondii p89 TaxID=943119 RepID=A0A086J8J5_TOXGO|nr:corepressor complex CRC230 [Toxoplasma gondii p89]
MLRSLSSALWASLRIAKPSRFRVLLFSRRAGARVFFYQENPSSVGKCPPGGLSPDNISCSFSSPFSHFSPGAFSHVSTPASYFVRLLPSGLSCAVSSAYASG